MKLDVASLFAGVLPGAVYGLINVRSPAPNAGILYATLAKGPKLAISCSVARSFAIMARRHRSLIVPDRRLESDASDDFPPCWAIMQPSRRIEPRFVAAVARRSRNKRTRGGARRVGSSAWSVNFRELQPGQA
ncbi:XapX domain-containing protein [Labilithrix luteola]|uniref:XapX domain-containing protein n=1 Tax=Labilithrix luteola TaxID=1391654 RepID=UPI000AE5152E